MSATGKTFDNLEERLEELYAKVDCLIADNEDIFLIKANISSANSVCAEMERLALKETNKERKKFVENASTLIGTTVNIFSTRVACCIAILEQIIHRSCFSTVMKIYKCALGKKMKN